MNHENELSVLQRFFNGKCVRDKPKFKVTDKVRISKYKHICEKGYTPNYTSEIFTIEKIKPTFAFTFQFLADFMNLNFKKPPIQMFI